MTIERINELFQNGSVTSEEHSFLVHKIYPRERSVSNFAWLSILCSVVAWILMLKFTHKNGKEYQLLPNEYRTWVGAILPVVALVFYYLAKIEIGPMNEKQGIEIAARGQTLALAML